MFWLEIKVFGFPEFDDFADVHHGNPIRNVLDDAQIVGDEQVGEFELGLKVFEEVQNLRLNRHVECGDGLVGDDQIRMRRERSSNADALPLSATEGVGVPA